MPENTVSDPMTDRQAAEMIGLNPDSAPNLKANPRVRAFMLQQQEAETAHRFHLDREQVLARLWEIAKLSPEMTRGSITGQVKALSIIVAIEGLVPDRRAAAQPKPAPVPEPQIYEAAWLVEQRAAKPPSPPSAAEPKDDPPAPVPAPAQEEAPGQPPPDPDPPTPSEAMPHAPHVSMLAPAPDTRIPFSIRRNPFGRPR